MGRKKDGTTWHSVVPRIESGAELKEYVVSPKKRDSSPLWVTERYFHEETFSLLGFHGRSNAPHQVGRGSGESLIHATRPFWLWRVLRWTG